MRKKNLQKRLDKESKKQTIIAEAYRQALYDHLRNGAKVPDILSIVKYAHANKQIIAKKVKGLKECLEFDLSNANKVDWSSVYDKYDLSSELSELFYNNQ